MSLILITGISTSGKSTVARELSIRGYDAYDTERNGISAWFNKKTGKRAAEFGKVPERTEEWLDHHEWLISGEWVTNIAHKAKSKTIFLCGGAANEPEIREMCDRVVWLKTNEATIRQRVNNPRDHNYGTKPHELNAAIKGNMQKEAEYIAYGATIVDATQSVHQVVEDILNIV